jgi:hypothetical protein
MSITLQVSSSCPPNFQPIFVRALQEFKKKTGKDLTAHPLTAQITHCDSPEEILAVLEEKANELKQSRSDDERLAKWLTPTVNILNALSATLGEGLGSVSYKKPAASLLVSALTLPPLRYSSPPKSSFLESPFSS